MEAERQSDSGSGEPRSGVDGVGDAEVRFVPHFGRAFFRDRNARRVRTADMQTITSLRLMVANLIEVSIHARTEVGAAQDLL
jgi:hypothetical protein